MNTSITQNSSEFDQHYATEQLRRSRHPLRRFIKAFYLRFALKGIEGPTIDFGCGAGQLLARLPAGSVGLEISPHLIQALRHAGFRVHPSHGSLHDFELPDFSPGTFNTLVISHVLEHLPDPIEALNLLLSACQRIGILRLIVIVPGAKGYATDHTHKTFIDRAYFQKRSNYLNTKFQLSPAKYFPFPWAWVGQFFTYQEMKIVFECTNEKV
jgi:SAM-dependent methyltransferase